MMRASLRSAALFACFALVACGDLVAFDTDLSASGEIPGIAPSENGLPKPVNASGSLSQSLDAKGVDVDHVKSIKVTAGRLAVTSASANNHLSYIQSFDVYVSAQGKDEVRIGSIPAEKFAGKPTSLDIVIDDVELKPYLVAGSMAVTPKIKLVTTSRPQAAVPISMSMTVHVVPQL